MPVFNGEAFIAQTLDSLVKQDYSAIRVLILDSQSTDRTRDICLAYCQRDPRVKYILGDRRRSMEDGLRELMKHVESSYVMFSCDDDVHSPDYVGRLMQILVSSEEIGVAYSNQGTVSSEGVRAKTPIPTRYRFKRSDYPAWNFFRYLFLRFSAPFGAGIFRKEVFEMALRHFRRVDQRKWDNDNLFHLSALSLVRVQFEKDVWFYYRQKDREQVYRARGEVILSDENILVRFWRNVLHECRLLRAIGSLLSDSGFTVWQRRFLLFVASVAGVYYSSFVYLTYIYDMVKSRRTSA
jgi:glycosyltransferase involved in cell wall biosynthesis